MTTEISNDCYIKWLNINHLGFEKFIPRLYFVKSKRNALWTPKVLAKMVHV
jgi:hypothetical protein